MTLYPGKSQDLHLVVKAAFGYSPDSDPGTWVFTDISSLARGSVSFSAGRPGQSGSGEPSSINLTLANNNANLTAQDPLSIYWPNIVVNVPLYLGITWSGAPTTYELLTCFINGWPLKPNAGVADVVIPITATGRLRRIQRSTKRVVSPMSRAIASSGPLAWWPLEEGAKAVRVASGVTGGPPMTVNGVVTFASGDGAPGTGPLADLSTGGQLAATLPTITSSSYRMEFVVKVPALPLGDFVAILDWYTTGGGIDVWEIDVTDAADGGLYVQWLAPDGSTTALYASNIAIDDGEWHHIRIDMTNTAGTQTVAVALDGTNIITHNSGRAWGVATRVAVNPTGQPSSEVPRFGQFAVWAPWSGTVDTVAAFTGFAGELATDRMMRLCAENNDIPITIVTGADVPSQAMGPQGVDTLANLFQACADIDNALLHDAGTLGALVFVSGTARYNAATAMTLDFNRSHIGDDFSGTYDDQGLINEWQISRTGGSSATVTDTDASDITGQYSSQGNVNAAADDQLGDIASFQVHLDTFNAYRFPQISVDMRRTPELAPQILAMVIPARISPTNLPAPYPAGAIDQFVEGYTATVDAVTWNYLFNCSPYDSWRAGVFDTSKADSSSSTLATLVSAGLPSASVALSVATALTGDLWTTTSADWTVGVNGPLYLYVDGEVMQVTNITGTSSPQTITVTRGINGVAIKHAAGLPVHVWQPAIAAL